MNMFYRYVTYALFLLISVLGVYCLEGYDEYDSEHVTAEGDLDIAEFLSSVSRYHNVKVIEICNGDSAIDLDKLSSATTLQRLKIYKLSQIRNIDSLYKLKNLMAIEIEQCSGLTDLSGLGMCRNLSELYIIKQNLLSLAFYVQPQKLKVVMVADCPNIKFITGVSEAQNLKILSLVNLPSIISLPSLEGMNLLQNIWISKLDSLTSLSGIENLSGLCSLHVSGSSVQSLSFSGRFPRLKFISLTCLGLTDYSAISTLDSLQGIEIYMERNNNLNLEILSSLNNLKRFYLQSFSKSIDFSPLSTMTSLQKITICPEYEEFDLVPLLPCLGPGDTLNYTLNLPESVAKQLASQGVLVNVF